MRAAYDRGMARIPGITIVGQAPPGDMADLFAQPAPPGTTVVLRADGCDVIVYACPGNFPPTEDDEGILFASRVPSGLLPRGRLDLPIPSSSWPRSPVRNGRGRDWRSSPRRWRRVPMAGKPRPRANGWLARKPDPASVDCMGCSPAIKEQVKPVPGVAALLAITATGRVLREMLE